MLIAVINESTLVSNDQVNIMSQAIQTQVSQHVLPAWNMRDATISFFPNKASIPANAWVVNVLDSPTQAGALGYHSEDNDVVDAFIFAQPVLSNGGVPLYDAINPQNTSVASVLSHEILEMLGDVYASFWCDGPQIKGQDGQMYSEYALELCDPVEGDSYIINLGGNLISVSNFVLPAWFNKEGGPQDAPFDYLHKLSAPFTMTPGGYLILRQSGNYTQVFGDKVSAAKQELVKAEWYRR